MPLDLLPGDEWEEERYRYLLQAAVDAGVNAIRVWGGGGRERKLFYDLCDELGLLVWQEMPIACVFLDHLPEDDEYLELVHRETRGIVQQLRGHPSLALWGGGNEWGPGRHKRLVKTLGQVISQEDPSRRWLLASPVRATATIGRSGMTRRRQKPTEISRSPAQRVRFAAPPDTETLASICPPTNSGRPAPPGIAAKLSWTSFGTTPALFD